MKNRSQPIAMQNVIDYLVAALTNVSGQGGVFEIGGPNITTYGDLMLRYARLRGLRRSMLLIPGIPLWFMAFGVGLMTPVPYPIAYALIGGLSADSVVKHPEALRAFPEVTLIDFDSAARDALEKTHPFQIERVWEDGKNSARSIKHEGCFIDHREVCIEAPMEKIISALKTWIGRSSDLIEIMRTDEKIMVSVKNQTAGSKWIEWQVGRGSVANQTYLLQTVFFCPHGLPGFLYWYLLYPFHVASFRKSIQAIAELSKIP
jgi:hypothetical protein